MTLLGSDGRSPARNIYKDPNNNFNGNIPIRVIWNATFNRWEIQSDLDTNGFYENLDYSNSFASYPNPPAVGTGTWVRHDFLCGSALTFNGTGTQTVLPIELTQFDINTEGGNFQIINLFGQQVLTGKTPPLGAGGLDVSALPQGTYFLKIEAEQAKFIKQ